MVSRYGNADESEFRICPGRSRSEHRARHWPDRDGGADIAGGRSRVAGRVERVDQKGSGRLAGLVFAFSAMDAREQEWTRRSCREKQSWKLLRSAGGLLFIVCGKDRCGPEHF